MTQPVNLDEEPWPTARALLEEFGEDAKEEVWRQSQQLARDGRVGKLPGMLALLRAIIALRTGRDPVASVH